MSEPGPLFRSCKRIARAFGGASRVEGDALEGGVVYLCRHSGATGPIRSLISLPGPVRPWILGEFFEAASCRRFFAEVTFRGRLRIPSFLSKCLAFVAAPPFSRLVRSTGGIPVYRNSPRARRTFTESAETLSRGGSLLIFPDVDYAGKREGIGELYRGFLALDRLTLSRSGEHAVFKPIHVTRKSLRVGRPISFTGSYRDQKDDVMRGLLREFRRLESSDRT